MFPEISLKIILSFSPKGIDWTNQQTWEEKQVRKRVLWKEMKIFSKVRRLPEQLFLIPEIRGSNTDIV